ncbi:4'-phosphopantetheinyl transferase superfamily protein (plasmid) [Photobacterium damselae]|uniref:4'-phosphopantetheinyl transferase family protein n=1 Tax=Photobacterium damselae TaxID=38293 RepID=UPI00254289EB
MDIEVKGKIVVSDSLDTKRIGLSDCKLIPSSFPFVDFNIHTVQVEIPSGVVSKEDFRKCGIGLPHNFLEMGIKRRREYLAGRFCARKALDLGGKFDLPPPSSNADRSPKWPDGIIGSISHTDHLAAACIVSSSHYRSLGIDIEPIMGRKTCKMISKDVLVEGEYYVNRPKSLHNLREEEYTTLIFSAKESIYKSLYRDVGQMFGFEAVRLEKVQGNKLTFLVINSLCDRWFKGALIDVFYQITRGNVYTLSVVE